MLPFLSATVDCREGKSRVGKREKKPDPIDGGRNTGGTGSRFCGQVGIWQLQLVSLPRVAGTVGISSCPLTYQR